VTEQAHPQHPAAEPAPTAALTAAHVASTGHPAVDEVLASLARLDDRPAADHIEVFESAHERLRSALADAGDTGTTG